MNLPGASMDRTDWASIVPSASRVSLRSLPPASGQMVVNQSPMVKPMNSRPSINGKAAWYSQFPLQSLCTTFKTRLFLHLTILQLECKQNGITIRRRKILRLHCRRKYTCSKPIKKMAGPDWTSRWDRRQCRGRSSCRERQCFSPSHRSRSRV